MGNTSFAKFLTCLALSFTLVKPDSISIKPKPLAPSGASQTVDHTFVSFAIQASSFTNITGNHTHPNRFSQNLIQNIANKTNSQPVIRVGGTNGDHAKFDEHQQVAITIPPSEANKTIPEDLTLGPSYFEGFSNFPFAQWIFSAPFVYMNLSECISTTKLAIQNIGSGVLNAIEIGNEPDLYIRDGDMPPSWTVHDYVDEWLIFTSNVANATGLEGERIFQAAALATPYDPEWDIGNLFRDGINRGNRVKTYAEHQYEVTAGIGPGLQATLMNHSFIINGLQQYKPTINYLQTNHSHVGFVLGEQGRFYSSEVNDNANLLGVFGSALWTIDYSLYSMSINVTRINWQQGIAFGYAGWHPIPYNGLPAAVRAPYYGYAFVADFIGTEPNMTVADLNLGMDEIAAYAAYQDGNLAKVAVINSEVYHSGDGTRQNTTVELQVPAGVESVEVKRLTGPGASSIDGQFTWGGVSWTYESEGMAVQVVNDTTIVDVKNSTAEVVVRATEAVLITLQT